jgi:hypothetical protein
MCKEPTNNTTGRDWWYLINHFNEEEYWEQQKKLNDLDLRLNDLDLRLSNFSPVQEQDIERFKKIFEVLQIEENEEEKIFSELSIRPNDITGYNYPNIHLSQLLQKGVTMEAFNVDPSQWAEKLNLSPTIGSGHIRVCIGIADSNEKAKIFLIKSILSGNMLPLNYLTLYKIDKGPGEICLIHVDNGLYLGKHDTNLPHSRTIPVINDRRIAFIRGNVAVYLISYYKNFGCMDLACRLDALIVEQMKKQQEQEKIKKEGTNQ